MTDLSFEEQRRKAHLSEDEFAAIQQPIDRKTGKVNPNFNKIYGSSQKVKERIADEQSQKEIEEAMDKQRRKEMEEEDRRLHPKYL